MPSYKVSNTEIAQTLLYENLQTGLAARVTYSAGI